MLYFDIFNLIKAERGVSKVSRKIGSSLTEVSLVTLVMKSVAVGVAPPSPPPAAHGGHQRVSEPAAAVAGQFISVAPTAAPVAA